MRNFEADLFMMVSRPFEANLKGKMSKYCRGEISGRKLVEIGSRPDSRRSRELNWRPGEPGEDQGGPNKGHLDPKIAQKIQKNGFPPGLHHHPVVCGDACLMRCQRNRT